LELDYSKELLKIKLDWKKMNQEYKILPNSLLAKICCPKTHEVLHQIQNKLVSSPSNMEYAISKSGIPKFALNNLSEDSSIQQKHYDHVAQQYIENLSYPHTIEYLAYLDREFRSIAKISALDNIVELCCGHGELFSLYGNLQISGLGIDISSNMLEAAKKSNLQHKEFHFVQGDATQLPIPSNSIDNVFIFGGIHHVPNRKLLFSEVSRILKPGGHFYFREPVSDFFIWRALRAIIYKLSPALDETTERPLLWDETVPVLKESGLELETWTTHGFLGFCLFMNSDVLVFNRLFKYIPGIKVITRIAAHLDKSILKIPGLNRCGLQVIGSAKKT
jgi:ubiquinone/menaquinone biosynthesis C-methylase UbiE